jgi:hypothetical protein
MLTVLIIPSGGSWISSLKYCYVFLSLTLDVLIHLYCILMMH